jgi:hypothetical protein
MPKRKYSQAEWARIQSRLPEEDRVPYSESPMVPTLEESQAALLESVSTSKTAVSDAEADIKAAQADALAAKQAQLDAAKNAATVAIQTGATLDPNTGMLTPKPVTPIVPPITPPITPPIIPPVIPQNTDPAVLALLQQLQAQNAALLAAQNQAKIDAAAADAAARKERADNAILALTDRFTKFGLASLVPKIRELAIGGATEATITLQLQETPEYQQRFRANTDRIKKGLSVLQPGEYLGLEDQYRQILRAYGLKQFDNDDYVSQFISNDISAAELSSRVVTAVQRVQNADPAVMSTLRDYYGIGNTDLVAYVLDPNQQFQKIERQVAAAEIGTAARRQGLEAGVGVSEQLAAQGVTQAQAQKGYATIADILPGATKLSQIYGGVLDQYGQAEAEQEVFNTLASAQRKRRALTEREIAAFGGASGLGKTALDQAARSNF